ncbi:MAG: hypothetical protein P4M09_29670 [Devosia sp.]|nr:hypothetical protein [Devosia sp.]
MFITRSAKMVVVIALVLLVPIAGMGLQSTAALEKFHNRVLVSRPETSAFLPDPAAFFAQERKWLADRVFPIIAASSLYDHLRLYLLQTPPQRRVTMAGDGFIFLNSGREDDLFGILQSVCIDAPSTQGVAAFRAALPKIGTLEKRLGVPIDILLFPTHETLYGDHLPGSVPKVYRDACGKRAAGESPLLAARQPGDPMVVFPLPEMMAARADPAFYPKGNWHAAGLSVKLVRDAYLAQLGVRGLIAETLVPGYGPSELLMGYGIDWELPVYRIVNPGLSSNGLLAQRIGGDIARLLSIPLEAAMPQVIENKNPMSPDRVLMLSDSFGIGTAPVFAGAFRQMIQFSTNPMPPAALPAVVRTIMAEAPVDRIVVLLEEGNVNRIVSWAAAL